MHLKVTKYMGMCTLQYSRHTGLFCAAVLMLISCWQQGNWIVTDQAIRAGYNFFILRGQIQYNTMQTLKNIQNYYTSTTQFSAAFLMYQAIRAGYNFFIGGKYSTIQCKLTRKYETTIQVQHNTVLRF